MSPRPESQPSMRQSVIQQQCVVLHLPTVASQCAPLAEQAERELQPYLGYLEALLAAELEDRERRAVDRRIKEAHLPRVKTLDEFDFRQAPTVSPTQLSELAEGGYLQRAEPIVFIGDSGTGKTHLLTALCVAACRQLAARSGALGALRRYRHRRGWLCAPGRARRRVFVPGHRRSRRTCRGVVDNELAIFGVDPGHSERALVQSAAGPHH